jgi:hypothetical protein
MRKIFNMKFPDFLARFHLLDWLVTGLILLYLIPIWAFQYIPTQDGPSHLNNAQILSQYTNPAYNFQKIYDLRLDPFPNWLSHAGLAALMWVFPPLVAEKILLSLYVIGFPLAFIYFLGAVDPTKKPLGLFSFAFIYNYLFMMGFYNFVFSIPLTFWTLGYFWKHRFRLRFSQAVLLNLLLLMVYFGHMITYLVALGSIAFIAVIHFIGQWISLHGSPLRRHIASLGISLISLAPTLPLLVNYYLGSSFVGTVPLIYTGRILDLLNDFISMRILVSYESYGQSALSLVVAVLLGLIFIITLIRRISCISFSQRRFFRFDDCILCLFIILFALYLLMPSDFGSGGWLNDRLALLGSLFLLAWCDISLPIFRRAPEAIAIAEGLTDSATPMQIPAEPSRSSVFFHETSAVIRRTWFNLAYPPFLAVLCCLVSLAILSGMFYSFRHLEPVLQQYTAGKELIKPNTVLLPLNFSTDEHFTRTDPLLHANHYYTLTNGAINLGNYEPFVDYFPLKFKPDLNLPIYLPYDTNWNDALENHQHILDLCSYTSMVDYLLVWGTPDYFFGSDIDRCYNLIYAKGRQKIYVPKR